MGGSAEIRLLRSIPPFDRLNDEEQQEAARALTPNTYGAGESVLQRWRPATHLHIVTEGLVEEQDAAGVVARYSPGAAFDYRALVQGRAENSFVARERTSCLLLPAPVLQALARRNRDFQAHWQDELARKADALIAVQQHREAASFLLARIGDGLSQPPLFVEPETTLQQAVALMNERRSSYVLVRRGGEVGIFTGRDVREQSVLMGVDGSTPIGGIASYNLVTLEQDDFLFNALALMTQHAIRHIVVTRGRDVVGVFEQTDLLRYLSDSSFAITNSVERAATPDEIERAGRSIPRLIASLYSRGVKPRYIARVVTNLNRKIFRRLFEQVVPEDLRAGACLIVMGSEGRGEQLLPTDQDNAVIFLAEPDRQRIEAPLQSFSAALADLGYPPCPGGIMVSNPAWAKSQAALHRDINHWLFGGDPEGLLNLAIFYDAAVVAGDEALLLNAKAHLFELVKQGESLGHFAKAIQQFPSALGFLNRFVTEKAPPHAGRIDLKKGGIFPIVHGIRSLALERQVAETNSIARIHTLTGDGAFTESFAADLIEAFDFMLMLRLRTQLDNMAAGRPLDNTIDPKALNTLDRNLLRDSFKVVKELKASISYHFKLSLVS